MREATVHRCAVRQVKARLVSSGVTQTVFRAQSPRCSWFTCLLGSGSVPQGNPFPSNESRGIIYRERSPPTPSLARAIPEGRIRPGAPSHGTVALRESVQR
jgi:hypothetical protein